MKIETSMSTPFLVLALLAIGSAAAAAQTGDWVVPRTEHGHPDLQGNWTNATMTPLQRPPNLGPTLTGDAVAEMEGVRQDLIDRSSQASDPDRGVSPVGGVSIGQGHAGFDIAAGQTGGYNYVYIDAGDRVAMVNGEYRSSLITTPENGRRPALTAAARQRQAAQRAGLAGMGQYDNPENRPSAERCILSFGSNAGPPMLPNYFYNNNYTIVQTPDHVMIHTEMVHDTRIIPISDHRPLPDDIRPYFGDSRGWYEGDALVIETTNIHPAQSLSGVPPTPETRVVERFIRVDEHTLNYEFMIHDPSTYEESWGGEVPFRRLPALVYEYSCHEGNYAMENVLRGARAQERE